MVLVSVLMASYNHERYLSEAIESVLNQTFPDLELIIVDDCSTDNSKQVIEKFLATDKRVRAFFHNKNMGIARTTNECLNAATGKYVSFISSDDVWAPSKLEKQLSVLSKDEDKVVWSEGIIINSEGFPTGQTFTQMNACGNKPKNGRIFREIINENYIFAQSLLFKREFCRNLSFNCNLKYLSDYQFMVDLSYNHDFVFIPEPLAKYRIHGKNTIFRDQANWLKDRVLLRSYFLERYGNSLSKHLKGNLYLKIGEAYLGLGQKGLAKQYFFEALRVDSFSKESLLYFTHAATKADSLAHKFLLQFYLKLFSGVA
jgi:glycosyltransferase involved in cell wall biosynthesis